MREDSRITVNTRTEWSKFVAGAIDAEETTAAMIKLGAAEFIRFRGVRTVEISVHDSTSSRMMVWRGTDILPD